MFFTEEVTRNVYVRFLKTKSEAEQTQATKDLLELFFVLGCGLTFLGAIGFSQFIHLPRAEIDAAQRRLRAMRREASN